jgi:hypothetical protein
MSPEEQTEYAEVICLSFTEREIEVLEKFSNFHFDLVDAGMAFEMADYIILDELAKEKEEDE